MSQQQPVGFGNSSMAAPAYSSSSNPPINAYGRTSSISSTSSSNNTNTPTPMQPDPYSHGNHALPNPYNPYQRQFAQQHGHYPVPQQPHHSRHDSQQSYYNSNYTFQPSSSMLPSSNDTPKSSNVNPSFSMNQLNYKYQLAPQQQQQQPPLPPHQQHHSRHHSTSSSSSSSSSSHSHSSSSSRVNPNFAPAPSQFQMHSHRSSSSSSASPSSPSSASSPSMPSPTSYNPTRNTMSKFNHFNPNTSSSINNNNSSSSNTNNSNNNSNTPGKKRRGNLPRPVTDILRQWLTNHIQHPYPTEEEKLKLMEQTGLTLNQLSNWFINARRRRVPKELQQQVGHK